MSKAEAPYAVNYWGSHPESGNDDCATGDDYATRDEAEAAYACDAPSYGDGTPIGWAYVEIVGPGVDKSRKNPERNAACAELGATADVAEWLREQAHQTGMAFGVDGYNDAMGY